MTRMPLTATTCRVEPGLAARAGALARRAWQAYWDKRAREATVRILHTLDARTLRDIGIHPGEIESTVYGRRGGRGRTYDAAWRCRPGV